MESCNFLKIFKKRDKIFPEFNFFKLSGGNLFMWVQHEAYTPLKIIGG
jgi:hypothetical protein